MATVDQFLDTFARANGPTLANGWSENGETGGGIGIDASSALAANAATGTAIQADDMTDVDVSITGIGMDVNVAGTISLCFRHQSAASVFDASGVYRVQFASAPTQPKLYRGATLLHTFTNVTTGVESAQTYVVLCRNTPENVVRIDVATLTGDILGTYYDDSDDRVLAGAFVGFHLDSVAGSSARLGDFQADSMRGLGWTTLGEGGSKAVLAIDPSDAVQETVRRPAIEYPSEMGYTQTRPRHAKARRLWKFTWKALSQAQLDTLEAFYATVDGPFYAWTWARKEPNGTTTTFLVHFLSDFESHRISPTQHRATATVQELAQLSTVAQGQATDEPFDLPSTAVTEPTPEPACDDDRSLCRYVVLDADINQATDYTDGAPAVVKVVLGRGDYAIRYQREALGYDGQFGVDPIYRQAFADGPSTIPTVGALPDVVTIGAVQLFTGESEYDTALEFYEAVQAGTWPEVTFDVEGRAIIYFYLDFTGLSDPAGKVLISICKKRLQDPAPAPPAVAPEESPYPGPVAGNYPTAQLHDISWESPSRWNYGEGIQSDATRFGDLLITADHLVTHTARLTWLADQIGLDVYIPRHKTEKTPAAVLEIANALIESSGPGGIREISPLGDGGYATIGEQFTIAPAAAWPVGRMLSHFPAYVRATYENEITLRAGRHEATSWLDAATLNDDDEPKGLIYYAPPTIPGDLMPWDLPDGHAVDNGSAFGAPCSILLIRYKEGGYSPGLDAHGEPHYSIDGVKIASDAGQGSGIQIHGSSPGCVDVGDLKDYYWRRLDDGTLDKYINQNGTNSNRHPIQFWPYGPDQVSGLSLIPNAQRAEPGRPWVADEDVGTFEVRLWLDGDAAASDGDVTLLINIAYFECAPGDWND